MAERSRAAFAGASRRADQQPPRRPGKGPTPDFSDLDLAGLDEVWAIALHDKKLTVLRLRSSDDWEHRANLEVS